MRKLVAIVLACLILSGAAFAQSAGNLNNGAFVEAKDGVIFASTGDKIVKIDGATQTTLAETNAYMLQIAGDRLYYVQRVFDDDKYGYYEEVSQTPMSMALDGTDVKSLGDFRTVGILADYEEYSYDTLVGYSGFTVYNDRIYYLANGDEGGEYTCNIVYYDEDDNEDTQSQLVTYKSGISLFSMALDGTDVKEVIKNVGNGLCAFTVADDKIYLASSFADMLYAYYYTDFAVYGLDGQLIMKYPAVENELLGCFSDSGSYYAIADSCQVDSGSMYVSIHDSEGDFRSSQLCKMVEQGGLESVLIQDSMINSVIFDSNVCYVGSASENTFYDDEFDYDQTLGIYVKKLTEDGLGQKLTALEDDTVYGVAICVLDGWVYYKDADAAIYRVPLAGGDAETVVK